MIRSIAKYLLVSALIFAVISAIALVVTYVNTGQLSAAVLFTPNIVVGIIIVLMGIMSLSSLPPVSSNPSQNLGRVDAKTFNILLGAKKREEPQFLKFMCVGVGIVILAGLTDLLLAVF